jgi:hypothetical protein
MLFRKKITQSCTYCCHGTVLEEGQILCTRRGVVQEMDKCRKFKYDPCKRIPTKPKPLDFSQYDDCDFSL